MKLTTFAAAVAATLVFAQTAHARDTHHWHGVYHRYGAYYEGRRDWIGSGYSAARDENHSWPWRRQNSPAKAFAWPARSPYRYAATTDENYNSPWRYSRSPAQAYARPGRRAYRGRYGGRPHLWSAQSTYRGGYGGRPRAWCGWEMRQLVGGDPGPQFNLARNWARWGHAGPAGIGAVVVWPHHVGKIVGQDRGRWIIQSGNDGNRLRTRPLSIGGAIAIRWS